jgi:hypothetical protein
MSIVTMAMAVLIQNLNEHPCKDLIPWNQLMTLKWLVNWFKDNNTSIQNSDNELSQKELAVLVTAYIDIEHPIDPQPSCCPSGS